MSSKFLSVLSHLNYSFHHILVSSLFTLYFLFFTLFIFPETIDRIIAVVNDQVITLTDIRIVKAFGFYEKEIKGHQAGMPSFILERLIDQKLVIQLSSEEVKIDKEEVEAYLKKMSEKIGDERVQKTLAELGFDLDGLREYIHEKILFQKLISRKFGQSVVVTLDEIENYYKGTYVSFQREKGLEPQPMIELLHEIESTIREDKIKKHIEDWINKLKSQADIQIKIENLNEYFEKEGSKIE